MSEETCGDLSTEQEDNLNEMGQRRTLGVDVGQRGVYMSRFGRKRGETELESTKRRKFKTFGRLQDVK
jgi:hypothetical protein